MTRAALVTAVTALVLLFVSAEAEAACMNRFVAKKDGPRQSLTILTGMLTFQDAQTLAAAIKEKKKPGIEWVDASGKPVARQIGELAVVRPMPVGCDGRASGVVLSVSFMSGVKPGRTMFVKFDDGMIVQLDEQSN